MVDYIIVGSGLAGIAMCETLEQHHKTYVVFDNDSQKSSTVAGGLYNPVILKRFTKAWNADVQLKKAVPFYNELEKKLQIQVDQKLPVYRRFASVEEQNLWFEAADHPALEPFLSTRIIHDKFEGINANFGFGEVLGTGRIDTGKLIQTYKNSLREKGLLKENAFVHKDLHVLDDNVIYEGLEAKNIVFCEGFGIKENPFFNYLPLNGTKGELLTVRIPGLEIPFVLKSSAFIIPLGNQQYRLGATYAWQDKTNEPTKAGREELLEKLESFISAKYEVLNHVAGIRPTVADRRPLLGTHPVYRSLHILNGLGSRGVMTAPYAAEMLYNAIEKGETIVKDADIVRFKKRWR